MERPALLTADPAGPALAARPRTATTIGASARRRARLSVVRPKTSAMQAPPGGAVPSVSGRRRGSSPPRSRRRARDGDAASSPGHACEARSHPSARMEAPQRPPWPEILSERRSGRAWTPAGSCYSTRSATKTIDSGRAARREERRHRRHDRGQTATSELVLEQRQMRSELPRELRFGPVGTDDVEHPGQTPAEPPHHEVSSMSNRLFTGHPSGACADARTASTVPSSGGPMSRPRREGGAGQFDGSGNSGPAKVRS